MELCFYLGSNLFRDYFKLFPFQFLMNIFKKQFAQPFSDLKTGGRGFMVGGQRFVHHSNLRSRDSAAISITSGQKLFLLCLVVCLGLLLYIDWFHTALVTVVILTTFYFADLLFGLFLAYRSFTRNPEVSVSDEELAQLKPSDLPRYTIFCPLYKEWQVLPQFVEAMNKLDYPKAKLQVMLQLEEDDAETVSRARAMGLPKHFKIVVVPNSKPKTKPKAMNYGLQFATGEIVTIYDAEDVPEPLQLKKVVAAFKKLPEEVICVQGKLNFYNPYQNVLTRMFTAEYSLWFDLVLPGLQTIGAPIPLGGTSNHFKKSILHELAGWDAYNVTEDCDLGMRLAKRGYRTAIVDSTTLEEANSGYHNWYRQRSRWIKGYMQTYLVHMRSPRRAVREFGFRNMFLLQLTVGGKVLSMFVNPVLWVLTLAYFAFRAQVAPVLEPLFPPVILYIGVFSLFVGNFFYMYAYLIGLAKRKEFGVMKYVFFVPVYWLAMSVAAWKAFYELLIKPHYWQKTNHGLHLQTVDQSLSASHESVPLGVLVQEERAFEFPDAVDATLPVAHPRNSILKKPAFAAALRKPGPKRMSVASAVFNELTSYNLPPTTSDSIPVSPAVDLQKAILRRKTFIRRTAISFRSRLMGEVADPITKTESKVFTSESQKSNVANASNVAGAVGGMDSRLRENDRAERGFDSAQRDGKPAIWLNVTGYMLHVLRRFGLEDLAQGGWLVAAMMLANVLNFVFSALLGRSLSPENFGTLSLFSTVILLTGIVTGSIGGSITYRVARYLGSNHKQLMRPFVRGVGKWSLFVGITAAVVWVVIAPSLAQFFNISQTYIVVAFAPIFPIMLSQGIWGGFLRGDFAFKFVALGVLADPVIKLLTAGVLILLGREDLAPVAILCAVAAGWFTLFFLGRKKLAQTEVRNEARDVSEELASESHGSSLTAQVSSAILFPRKYFYSALLASSSTTLFLTADVILVKHYFTPQVAGSYALLSLCGGMIVYLCSLASVFITTSVSRERGQGGSGRKSFLPLFRLVVAAAFIGFVGIGLLGKFTIPLLFGSNATPILPYLPAYAAAMAFLAVSSSYIAYRLAKDDYGYAWFGVLGAVVMSLGIMYNHDSVGSVAQVVLAASSATAVLLFAWHAVTQHGRFVFRNLIDLLDVFAPLPGLQATSYKLHAASSAKRILIFNWRDTKHTFAGGAEVYVHEMAKRWVGAGNSVTVFCGSDGNNLRFEAVDGVNIIRRGGFYMVWFWAFVYYMLRLRGKFDIILDSDSALPFFTPLFVREPVVGLVHHVHQEIFKKHLVWPAALLARSIEKYFVPFVYRHTQLITVSESTKQDMLALGLTGSSIEVINPGVDVTQLMPGEKDEHPLVVYVGRLQAYKSVDVLIRAFELLHLAHPQARLVIAGGGEDEGNLKKLTQMLGLTSVVSFLGKIEEELKVFLMQQAWVFANPSSMEGWGITSIEANACGTPVVASNVPGLRDSVQNPHTGYLVEYGNPAAFAEKIDLLISNSKQRHFMEQESLDWAAKFDWNEQAEKALEVMTKN